MQPQIYQVAHLKEELAWALDKWLQVISNIIKTVLSLSNYTQTESILNLKKYYTHCYMALGSVF